VPGPRGPLVFGQLLERIRAAHESIASERGAATQSTCTGLPTTETAIRSPEKIPSHSTSPARGTLLTTGEIPPELKDHPQYELIKELGRGGMGTVYLARNKLMDRLEVLKVLSKELLTRKGTAERFLREIQLAARLHHPNVVAAYAALTIGDRLALAMEYIEGDDFGKVLRANGPLPVVNACYFASQVARGLQHAHERGMIHRDIKPANLILKKEGKKATVKILDFGLAKVTSEESTDGGLTHEGQILGTPDYIAPEQTIDAQNADIRADIYSLGCTLYHMLAGSPPFGRSNLYEILRRHQSEEPKSLNLVRPDVPPELAHVVAKMVAKDPNARYQTPAEVVNALKPFLKRAELSETRTILRPAAVVAPAPAAPTRKDRFSIGKRRILIGIGALCGVLLLAGLLVKVRTKDGTLVVEANEPDAVVEVLNEQGQVEIIRAGGNGRLSISVDPGKHRLKVTKDGFQIYVKEFEIESAGSRSISAKLVPLEAGRSALSSSTSAKPQQESSRQASFDAWLQQVSAFAPEKQVESVAGKLRELNPGFDDKVKPTIQNGAVTGLEFSADQVADISPVRALPALRSLICSGMSSARLGKIRDLSPLRGMRLQSFDACCNPWSDLAPLQGMPLRQLNCRDTLVASLEPLRGMKLRSLTAGGTRITDLGPLKGMPLQGVYLDRTAISDLTPLTGMRLRLFVCSETRVSNLSSLKGMPLDDVGLLSVRFTDLSPLTNAPLRYLQLNYQPKRDREFLRNAKTLYQINNRPAKEFLREVVDASDPSKTLNDPAFQNWLKEVTGLPADKQVTAVAQKLRELNPRFDGRIKPTIENGVVTGLEFDSFHVCDLSPVRALRGLTRLDCRSNQHGWTAELRDLLPLNGMKLKVLNFRRTPVYELSPLRGLPLTSLDCESTCVSDLTPLEGMRLEYLNCGGAMVSDLKPLHGMPLTILDCGSVWLSDLSPLKGMPLRELAVVRSLVTDLSPLVNSPIEKLNCSLARINDFTPLTKLRLTYLMFDFELKRDSAIIRSIETLETINEKPVNQFWAEQEARQKARASLPRPTSDVKLAREMSGKPFEFRRTPRIVSPSIVASDASPQ